MKEHIIWSAAILCVLAATSCQKKDLPPVTEVIAQTDSSLLEPTLSTPPLPVDSLHKVKEPQENQDPEIIPADSLVEPTEIHWIDVERAVALIDSGAALVDVSHYGSYLHMHAVGATYVSSDRLSNISEVFPDTSQRLVLISYEPRMTRNTARLLSEAQYPHIYAVEGITGRSGSGGTISWQKAGYPVEGSFQLNAQGHSFGYNREKRSIELTTTRQRKTVAVFPVLPSGEHEYDHHFYIAEYELSYATVYSDTIWVGFSFYDGEGSTGIGGIGFYDPLSQETGVLRHPALSFCSLLALEVTSDSIYVQTVGNYELGSSVCNGLVVIDRSTLDYYTLSPDGPSLLWHKDGGETSAHIYNQTIQDLLKDPRMIRSELSYSNESSRKQIIDEGLDTYMKRTAMRESLRHLVSADAGPMVHDELIGVSPWQLQKGIGSIKGLVFKGIQESSACDYKGFSTLELHRKLENTDSTEVLYRIRASEISNNKETQYHQSIADSLAPIWTHSDSTYHMLVTPEYRTTYQKECTTVSGDTLIRVFDSHSFRFQKYLKKEAHPLNGF